MKSGQKKSEQFDYLDHRKGMSSEGGQDGSDKEDKRGLAKRNERV